MQSCRGASGHRYGVGLCSDIAEALARADETIRAYQGLNNEGLVCIRKCSGKSYTHHFPSSIPSGKLPGKVSLHLPFHTKESGISQEISCGGKRTTFQGRILNGKEIIRYESSFINRAVFTCISPPGSVLIFPTISTIVKVSRFLIGKRLEIWYISATFPSWEYYLISEAGYVSETARFPDVENYCFRPWKALSTLLFLFLKSQ